MKKLLITGFEPFGEEERNPSFDAIKNMKDTVAGITVIKKEIPVVFHESISCLDAYIKEFDPDIIICVGQAGGRYAITPERVAINIDDARIPDNKGNSIVDKPIFEDGKNAYFSLLPIKKIVSEMRNKGVVATVSNSAGTYVCNHLMYGLLYLLDKKYPTKKGGFIHVPYASFQVVEKQETPSMSLDEITKGLSICVENSFADEISVSEGKLH